MAMWLTELRYAARVLWRNRGVNLVAFLTLALAIGANTAIFSVVYALLLRPLPYPDADRLVQLGREYVDFVAPHTSLPRFFAWRSGGSRLFSHVAAYEDLDTGFNLVGTGTPERVRGSRVSVDFFGALGVAPVVGRGFLAEEDRPGGPKVAVVSDGLWRRRFGARADLVGQTIALNAEPHTIVGIMPPGFAFPRRADVWTPYQLDPASRSRANYVSVVARLRPGVTVAQAAAAMQGVAAEIRARDRDVMDEREAIAVRPLRDQLYGSVRTALLVLLAAVAFVLLIACVNVAHLQLAQAAARRREIAVRSALGASAGRVVRQLLTECVLLASVSGLAGIALAWIAIPLLLALSTIDTLPADQVHLNLPVLLFALTLSCLAGMVFGVMPAWQAARTSLDDMLREGARRTTGGRAGAAMRRVLVAGEVALALVLTIGGGLLIKSFARLQAVEPGLNPDRVLTMKASLAEGKYGTSEALARLAERLDERVKQVPGVEALALTQSLPLEMGMEMPFTIEGRYAPGGDAGTGGAGTGQAQYRAVGHEYFAALQIALRRGRAFDARDRRGALPVAIVNETAARRFFGSVETIGQRITIGQPFLPAMADPLPREIVGIVSDVREVGLADEAPPLVYVPLPQQNDMLTQLGMRVMPFVLIVRTTTEPAGLAPAVQQAIWRIDPEQPVTSVRLMRDVVSTSIGSPRFNTLLLGLLAGLALLLAAVGLYGVLSHLVGQQTREIGVRMALGATEPRVLRQFLTQGLSFVLVGVAVGLAGAVGLTRFLRTLLVGVSTLDPWMFAAAPLVLCGVALIAIAVPARRAARVDPARALRAD